MDGPQFIALLRAWSRSRRSVLATALVTAGALFGRTAVDAKKKRQRKRKKKKPQNVSCDPPCGPGMCVDGVCDCTQHIFNYQCGETCCEREVHGCLDNACCPNAQICNGACCPDGESCVNGATCCPDDRACGETCCSVGQACGGTVCCPVGHYCPGFFPRSGVCCHAGEPCIDKKCCPEFITVRGEQCCPRGTGNYYTCGRFTCLGYLTGAGPGGCDLWCDTSQEGSLCGPGVPGIPTGENNGRACCCTAVGTGSCVWP